MITLALRITAALAFAAVAGGLKVLCSTCGDAVTAAAECATCGEPEPGLAHPDARTRLDETLLTHVGLALAAQAKVAQATALRRNAHAVELNIEAVELRGRLRTQVALLRGLVARRGELVDARAALSALESALATPPPASEVAPGWNLEAELPRDPSCAGVARRLLREYVLEELDPTAGGDALLAATELVTNALRHGVGKITFGAERVADALRIEVLDGGGPGRIVIGEPGAARGGGRGLWMINRVALAWGVDERRARVWAELPLRDSALRA